MRFSSVLLLPVFRLYCPSVQSGSGGGITQTVQCPVHLLPSIQRLSRKIQAESGANCVFANCKVERGRRIRGRVESSLGYVCCVACSPTLSASSLPPVRTRGETWLGRPELAV